MSELSLPAVFPLPRPKRESPYHHHHHAPPPPPPQRSCHCQSCYYQPDSGQELSWTIKRKKSQKNLQPGLEESAGCTSVRTGRWLWIVPWKTESCLEKHLHLIISHKSDFSAGPTVMATDCTCHTCKNGWSCLLQKLTVWRCRARWGGGGSGVQIPCRRRLFFHELSWCRGSHGKMNAASSRPRPPHPPPPRLILGNNCRGRRTTMVP